MGTWSDGSIKWASGALTADFADNNIDAENVRQGDTVLYIDYTKGTEVAAEVQVYFDNSDRAEYGSDEWYPNGVDGWWPVELTVPASTSLDHIIITPIPYRMTATGKYRVVVMKKLPRECYIRVAVRAVTPGATPGTIGLRWCTDEISWGGVGQG